LIKKFPDEIQFFTILKYHVKYWHGPEDSRTSQQEKNHAVLLGFWVVLDSKSFEISFFFLYIENIFQNKKLCVEASWGTKEKVEGGRE
jgi:hypothetical protein